MKLIKTRLNYSNLYDDQPYANLIQYFLDMHWPHAEEYLEVGKEYERCRTITTKSVTFPFMIFPLTILHFEFKRTVHETH